jgi:hypothetical protein
MTGRKSDTLPPDYLPEFKATVNVTVKYVTLNTTYSFRRSAILLQGSLPVFINGYGVPFLIYYMLVLLIDLHKQLLFASGKDPAQSFSDS